MQNSDTIDKSTETVTLVNKTKISKKNKKTAITSQNHKNWC